MEEEGPPQEVDAPPKPKELEVKKEDISRIDKDLKKNEGDHKKIKMELAGKAPYWMFAVLFILLGGVGAGFLLNGFVFKTATWAGYLIGVGGTAIIAYLYKVWEQAKVEN